MASMEAIFMVAVPDRRYPPSPRPLEWPNLRWAWQILLTIAYF
jgi:hypothetical protein